ncbi:MAG: hypothetical protein QM784_36810 [Polyangiaceae bacterium]
MVAGSTIEAPRVANAVSPVSAAVPAQRTQAPAEVPAAPTSPAVSPLPAVEQLPSVALNTPEPSAPAANEVAPIAAAQPVEAATAAQLAPSQDPLAPAVSAPLAPAPTEAPAVRHARAPSPSQPLAASSGAATGATPAAPEVLALPPTGLTPADTKAVLTQLADDERATAAADEQKREEERKLPSTARLKAPSVRIEASRIAAALKKASQEAVARVHEEQAPAAPKAESKPADNLPDNPF